jgi:hypothetical protein
MKFEEPELVEMGAAEDLIQVTTEMPNTENLDPPLFAKIDSAVYASER